MKLRILLSAMALCFLAVGLFAQNPLPVPQNLEVHGVPGTVPAARLDWQAPSGQWAFRVYRSTGDTSDFHVIGSTMMRSFYDNHLNPGIPYFYYVVSYTGSPSGGTESPRSNIVAFTFTPPPPPPRGTIQGTVVDDSTGLPLRMAKITFQRVLSPLPFMRQAVTDSLGQYSALLDTGTYLVRAELGSNHPGMPGYIPEWYDNAPDPGTATPIAVAENSSFVANFGLARRLPPPPSPQGVIAGTVVDDSTGLPIRGARIRFFRQVSPTTWGPQVITDSLGEYHAVLNVGTYLVRAEGPCQMPGIPGYMPEWYDNAPDPGTATPIAVAESSLFVANFGLSRPAPPTFATVSGTVTDTLGNPIPGASVALMRSIQELAATYAVTGQTPGIGEEQTVIEGVGGTRGVVWHGRTDSLGHYAARVISGRSYIALASKMGYLPEYFENATSPADADIIAVNGDVNNIDFSLAVNPLLQNSISGRVRDSLDTGVPARVMLLPLRNTPHPSPWHGRFAHTDSTGAYAIHNVMTGRYFVLAMPFSGFAPAFYKAGEFGVSRWQDADTVEISGAVTGIDIGVVPVNNGGIARIRGRVISPQGVALEGVSVLAMSGATVASFTVTDGSGSYTLEAVNEGEIRIMVDKEGRNPAETAVTVTPTTYTVDGVNLVMSSALVLGVGSDTPAPARYQLEQNYPNPFNPATTISFSIPTAGPVSLTVYNLIGQEVARLVDGIMDAGIHAITWSGDGLPSGVYLYRLTGNGFTQTRKLVLVK